MSIPLSLILFYSSAFSFSLILAFCIFLIATTKTYPVIHRSKREKYFFDPETGKLLPFPSISDTPSVNLSVIVPAYNEEARLPPMLNECLEFLDDRSNRTNSTYEIIVVSDGSKDRTVEIAIDYCTKVGSNKLRVLELQKNRGKGGAVQLGVQSARGALLLFADADGATKFSELVKVEECLAEMIKCDLKGDLANIASKKAMVIGSRAHLEKEAIATRSAFRTFLMHGFHFLVSFFGLGVRDTQCGFKLFTRETGRVCFESLHVQRWAFDVELLYIAKQLKIPIKEIPVHWTEIDGSKLIPVWSWIQMAIDLALIYLRYLIGAWKIKEH